MREAIPEWGTMDPEADPITVADDAAVFASAMPPSRSAAAIFVGLMRMSLDQGHTPAEAYREAIEAVEAYRGR